MATFVTAMLDGREPYDIYRWAEQLFADRDHLAAIEALEYLMDRAPDEGRLVAADAVELSCRG